MIRKPDPAIYEVETIMKSDNQPEKVRYFFLGEDAKWWHVTKRKEKPVTKERIKEVIYINWGVILILTCLLSASVAFNIVMFIMIS
jgi:hypothetical protein